MNMGDLYHKMVRSTEIVKVKNSVYIEHCKHNYAVNWLVKVLCVWGFFN